MSVHNMHLLAPGESFRPWPKPPEPPNRPDLERKDAASTCGGCGAGLQAGRWSCAWCTLPYPNAPRGDLSALIEVTTLADPWPRYRPGWEPPRPLPPASRLVTESGRQVVLEDDSDREWRARHPYPPDPFPFPRLKRFCRWLLGVR